MDGQCSAAVAADQLGFVVPAGGPARPDPGASTWEGPGRSSVREAGLGVPRGVL